MTDTLVRNLLYFLSQKYEGDTQAIIEAVNRREETKDIGEFVPDNPNFFTIVDSEYPGQMKRVLPIPPIIVYYEGNLDLLKSQKAFLGVISDENPDLSFELRYFYPELVTDSLGENTIIVTNSHTVVDEIVDLETPIIYIMSKEDAKNPDDFQKDEILENGGLILTCYPSKASGVSNAENIRLFVSLIKGLVVCIGNQKTDAQTIVDGTLYNGKDVLVVPTLPEENCINNQLIKQGAFLVENAKDIADLLNINC